MKNLAIKFCLMFALLCAPAFAFAQAAEATAPTVTPTAAPVVVDDAPDAEESIIDQIKVIMQKARGGEWLALSGAALVLLLGLLKKFGAHIPWVSSRMSGWIMSGSLAALGAVAQGWAAGAWSIELVGEAIVVFFSAAGIFQAVKDKNATKASEKPVTT